MDNKYYIIGAIAVILIGILIYKFSLVEGFSGNSTKLQLYYADWCPACQKIKPVWDELKQEYKDNPKISMEEINCTDNQSDVVQKLLKESNIEGFPTIRKNGTEDYNGNGTKADLQKFIEG